MGNYFGQNFESEGSVESLVGDFVARTSVDEVRATVADIRRFISVHGDVERAHVQRYPSDIDPSCYNMTSEEWLNWVDRLISDQLSRCHDPAND